MTFSRDNATAFVSANPQAYMMGAASSPVRWDPSSLNGFGFRIETPAGVRGTQVGVDLSSTTQLVYLAASGSFTIDSVIVLEADAAVTNFNVNIFCINSNVTRTVSTLAMTSAVRTTGTYKAYRYVFTFSLPNVSLNNKDRLFIWVTDRVGGGTGGAGDNSIQTLNSATGNPALSSFIVRQVSREQT